MVALDKTDIENILVRLEEIGYLFGQYKLYKVNNALCLLGKGGFSSVYEMMDEKNPNNHYAMKVIGLERHTMTSDEFCKTTRLQRQLSEESQNILRIIASKELCIVLDEEGKLLKVCKEADADKDEASISLQLILMEKLDAILEKDKFKHTILRRIELNSEQEVLKYAKEIGQALLVAHNNNILHRDIKLENIFWDEIEERYKLGDFGIAKYVESGSAETIVYTDGYGAPEIERRLSENYNATADIYSLGISIYLLLNNLKFPGSEGYYVNMVQYSPDFVFPAPQNSSEAFTRVVRKMCSYYKEDRYATVNEFLAELNKISEPSETLVEADEELYDLETETYREVEEEKNNNSDNFILGRAYRKKVIENTERHYNKSNVWFLIRLSVLFALLIKGIQIEMPVVENPLFWLLPITVLVECVLLKIKEFHIVFGIMTLIFGIYTVFVTGFTVYHFIFFLSILIGDSIMVSAGAIGNCLWLLMQIKEEVSWLGFVEKYDISWIILVLLFIEVNRLIGLRIEYERISYKKAYGWVFCYDKLPIIMMIAGVVLFVLQYFDIIVIPEILQRLHLIRTGVVVFAVNVIRYMLDDKLEEEDENAEDVYMDE